MGASPLAAAPLPAIDPSGIGGTAAVEDAMAAYYVKRASYRKRRDHKASSTQRPPAHFVRVPRGERQSLRAAGRY